MSLILHFRLSRIIKFTCSEYLRFYAWKIMIGLSHSYCQLLIFIFLWLLSLAIISECRGFQLWGWTWWKDSNKGCNNNWWKNSVQELPKFSDRIYARQVNSLSHSSCLVQLTTNNFLVLSELMGFWKVLWRKGD